MYCWNCCCGGEFNFVVRQVSTQRVRKNMWSQARGETTGEFYARFRRHSCDPVLWRAPLSRIYPWGPEPVFLIFMCFFAYFMHFWEPFVSFCDVRRVSKPTIAFFIICGWILGGILETPGILVGILGTPGTPLNPIRCQVPHIYMLFWWQFLCVFFDAPPDGIFARSGTWKHGADSVWTAQVWVKRISTLFNTKHPRDAF